MEHLTNQWGGVARLLFDDDAAELLAAIKIDVGPQHDLARCRWDDEGSGKIVIECGPGHADDLFVVAHELAHAYHCYYFPSLTDNAGVPETEAVALMAEIIVANRICSLGETVVRMNAIAETANVNEEYREAWFLANRARLVAAQGKSSFKDLCRLLLEGKCA